MDAGVNVWIERNRDWHATCWGRFKKARCCARPWRHAMAAQGVAHAMDGLLRALLRCWGGCCKGGMGTPESIRSRCAAPPREQGAAWAVGGVAMEGRATPIECSPVTEVALSRNRGRNSTSLRTLKIHLTAFQQKKSCRCCAVWSRAPVQSTLSAAFLDQPTGRDRRHLHTET